MANKNVTYLFREVLLIVAGILIAFGLNAWWQGRTAYAIETGHLTRLEADLSTAEGSLLNSIELSQAKIELVRQFIATIGADPTPARADSLVAQGYELAIYNLFSEEVRAYDELVNSGNVDLITSQAIRTALQGYAYERKKVRDWDDYQEQFSVQIVEPAVLQRLPIKLGDEVVDAYSPPSFDSMGLFSDLVFWNLLRQRLDNEEGALRSREALLSSLRDARSLVRQELDRR